MNREYKEKLVSLVICHYAKRLLLPMPVRQVLNIGMTFPRILKAVKAAASGRLTVDVLDGIAIGA